MRLFEYSNGTYTRILCDVVGSMSVATIEERMRKFVHADGRITALCLDFGGAYIPLCHETEIPLAAKMLAQFHNQHINVNPEVCTI